MGRKKKKQLKPWCWYPSVREGKGGGVRPGPAELRAASGRGSAPGPITARFAFAPFAFLRRSVPAWGLLRALSQRLLSSPPPFSLPPPRPYPPASRQGRAARPLLPGERGGRSLGLGR